MIARLRKEARALLPYWAGALALVVAPYLLLGKEGAELSWFSYAVGCALLGGMSFGHELQHRTLTLLLSQPISRTAIWRDKMLVLAAALVTTTAALFALSKAFGGASFFDGVATAGTESVRFFPVVPLCVFCGAPLLTLLTGSALGGAVVALAAPGCCLTLAVAAHLLFPALGEATMTSTLVIIYCPLAFALGWMRLQNHQAQDLKSPALASWLAPRTSAPPGGPLMTLLRKELRLQYATFALAIALWMLFFFGGVISDAGKGNWPGIASAVTGVDLFVLPLVAGAVALGEERTLGVADWQLTLPPSARKQWLAKMIVLLPTSLLFGLVLPLLARGALPDGKTMVIFVVAHLLLTHLALYAGSISNGTMPAVLLALAFWSAAAVAVLYGGLVEKLGGPPKLAVAMAALMVLLHAFAFSNYRQRALRPRRLGFQGLAATGLLAVFVAIG